ncbi:MAG TPA: HNH endonuclease [Hymenobacter sp.]
MINFRNHLPMRRANRAECEHYSAYRDTLRVDFDRRCGYCNDYDKFRIRSFTLDHFLPRNPIGFSHCIKPNNYYNLVYACMHCNLAKSNKWPTNDANVPNDGNMGFVDPTLLEYSNLFERSAEGDIIPKQGNKLAAFIIIELNLWLPFHAKMWRFEMLKSFENQLKALPHAKRTERVNDKIAELAMAISELIDDIFAGND